MAISNSTNFLKLPKPKFLQNLCLSVFHKLRTVQSNYKSSRYKSGKKERKRFEDG